MDYKETVFLPKTEFPMKAGLPRKEPEILKIWEEINIYQKLREPCLLYTSDAADE